MRAAVDEQGDRRAQILAAAFAEFAAKGFKGATIKSIAQRASLQSQALIYWYFPTKEALFQEVLARRLPVLQVVLDADALLDRPPEDVLPLLARAYLATAEQPDAQRLLRLIIPEAIRRPEMAAMVGSAVIAKALAFITAYLERQIALGRLRPHDVRASARAFVGMLLPQLAGKVFLPVLRADGPTDAAHVELAVTVFLRGLGTKA